MKAYDEVFRDCQYIHGFTEGVVQKFLDLANVFSGMNVLDAMCGNGVLSKELIKIKGINLSLLDNSENQLKDAKKQIKNAKFYTESILKTTFEDEKFDKVFIRTGIHEVNKEQQKQLYKEVFRIIKKKGQFLIWAVKLNKKNQKYWIDMTRYKDELAGYEELKNNRYLFTKKELVEGLKNAEFNKINFYELGINYIFTTNRWGKIDFGNDPEKIKKMKDYLLTHPDHYDTEIKVEGENVLVIVPALIGVAEK